MELSRRIKRGRIGTGFIIILVLAVCVQILSACSFSPKKKALRMLIIPKFEVGRMSGDFPGEAQLFYEKYCPGCEEVEIPHMPLTAHFYLNEKIENENTETLDIFEPAMHNLFDTSRIVIDAALNGEL